MSREISAWQKEIRRNPGSAAFARLAERLREEGRLDEATWICSRGLAANPRYSSGHVILGEILYQVGLKARAKEEFLLGIDLDAGNTRARLGVSRLLLEQKNASQAIEHLEEILFWQPQHEEARKLAEQARAFLRTGQVEDLIGPQKAVSEAEPEETAQPAPVGLVKGRESELAQLLTKCDSVSGALIVNAEGLLVASDGCLSELKDDTAARLASMCDNANRYLMKLGLGYLENGLIEEAPRSMRIFRYQEYILAVALKEAAALGTAEVEIAKAIEGLDRRRKVRSDDAQQRDLSAEAKHA